MKALGLVVSDKKIFESFTTLIGDHPGIIPVKFGQNPISGFRGDVVEEIVDARTHARTDDGRQTLKDHKSSLSTSCSGELKRLTDDGRRTNNEDRRRTKAGHKSSPKLKR